VEGGERGEQVQGDVDGLPVAQVPVSADELIQRFPVDELGDEIPVAGAGLAGPEDLHHVGVVDLPQRADLTAHRLVPGGAVEQLERSLLILDVIAHAVDLREAALPEYLEDLETAVENVADRVVNGLPPARGPYLGRVRFREGLAAIRVSWQAGPFGRNKPAGPAPARVRLYLPDPPDGVHQARMQHVRADLGREMKLLDVAHRVEPAPPVLVQVPEQPVLPQHRGEVRRLLEVHIRHFLQGHQVPAREPVGADHPDERTNFLLHAADIGLGAGEQFGVVVQRGALRHQVRGDLVGALRELRVAEPLGAALHHPLQHRRRQAVAAGLLLPQDLLAELVAERDDVARDQPGVAEQVVLDGPVAIGSRPVAVDPEPVADRGRAGGGAPHQQGGLQPLQLLPEQIEQRAAVPGQDPDVRFVVVPRRVF
jgi:hypothetical protein